MVGAKVLALTVVASEGITGEEIRTLTSVVAVCISLAAFFLSLYSIWRTRKKLHVYFDDELLRPKGFYNSCGEPLDGIDGPSLDAPYICAFNVINPSHQDIAYFNVEVVLIKAGTLKHIKYINGLKNKDGTKGHVYFYSYDDPMIRGCSEPSSSGVFKSQSYQHFKVPFLIDILDEQEYDRIYIGFKTAQLSLKGRFNKYVRTNYKRFYKNYYRIYDLR